MCGGKRAATDGTLGGSGPSEERDIPERREEVLCTANLKASVLEGWGANEPRRCPRGSWPPSSLLRGGKPVFTRHLTVVSDVQVRNQTKGVEMVQPEQKQPAE